MNTNSASSPSADSRDTSAQTSTQPTAAPTPAQVLSSQEREDSYLLQLMLLDQQNKGRPGYVPAMTDPSRRPRRLDEVIGNLFVDGEGLMTCHTCVGRTFETDASLWPDLKRHVHFSIPVDLKTGPDLHQCFCGYFSFRAEDLQTHFATTSAEAAESGRDHGEVLAGLTSRIEQVGMHQGCQRQLVDFVNRQEYTSRAE